MSASIRRFLFWALPVAVLVLALVYAFRPQPIDVDLWRVQEGPLVVGTTAEGETRIRDVFVLSAPVQGRAKRIELREGDRVVAGVTIVAEIEPSDPVFLDMRTEAEHRAAVRTARAAIALAEAERLQAEAELDFAKAELDRAERLRAREAVSTRAAEDAQRTYLTRKARLATAMATIDMRKAELTAAEARLMRPQDVSDLGDGCPCIGVTAPVSGRVLRVLHESEGVVRAGEPLIEIGNPQDLEIIIDFISADAVRIVAGQRAIVADWGGDEPLNGTVERVEPFGFTKVSALGIEEQRVNAIIALTDPPERWVRLGHGFQVEATVVLWESDTALIAPVSALFREGERWAVFAVADDVAHLRPVTIGQSNGIHAQIVDGLQSGEAIVRYPNERIINGANVRGH